MWYKETLSGLVDHTEIWSKLTIICITMFLITSYANHHHVQSERFEKHKLKLCRAQKKTLHFTSLHITSHHITSHHTTPHRPAPSRTVPHRTASSNQIKSHQTKLFHLKSYCIGSDRTAWHYITPHHIIYIPHHITSHHITLHSSAGFSLSGGWGTILNFRTRPDSIKIFKMILRKKIRNIYNEDPTGDIKPLAERTL